MLITTRARVTSGLKSTPILITIVRPLAILTIPTILTSERMKNDPLTVAENYSP